MKTDFQRKKYLVHPSSQFKYIAIGVLPAFVIGIFSLYLLLKTGEMTLQAERAKLSVEISSLNYTIQELQTEKYPPEIVEKIKGLKKELISLQNILKLTYYDTLKEWNKTKVLIFIGLFSVLIIVGIVSLLYSHRVAGPLVRLKTCIDTLSEGKDTSVIQVRRYDEFKELAESLEKLREGLKSKGMLK